ncbi:hypothetical protein AgCh_012546 [Apium graveolens]
MHKTKDVPSALAPPVLAADAPKSKLMPVDLSNIPPSFGVEEFLNREPAPLDKERAEEILREMVEEKAARLRQAAANNLDPIHLDSEFTDSDLGSEGVLAHKCNENVNLNLKKNKILRRIHAKNNI